MHSVLPDDLTPDCNHLQLHDDGPADGGAAAGDKKRIRRDGRARPLALGTISLDQPGFLRAGHLLTLFAITSPTLYKRIRQGQIPKPDGYDCRRPFWHTATIRPYFVPTKPAAAKGGLK
jgi:hypothetical protein